MDDLAYFVCNNEHLLFQAAVKFASSPRTNALSTKPRLPLAALAGDATRNHTTGNVNSHVSYKLLTKHLNRTGVLKRNESTVLCRK